MSKKTEQRKLAIDAAVSQIYHQPEAVEAYLEKLVANHERIQKLKKQLTNRGEVFYRRVDAYCELQKILYGDPRGQARLTLLLQQAVDEEREDNEYRCESW